MLKVLLITGDLSGLPKADSLMQEGGTITITPFEHSGKLTVESVLEGFAGNPSDAVLFDMRRELGLEIPALFQAIAAISEKSAVLMLCRDIREISEDLEFRSFEQGADGFLGPEVWGKRLHLDRRVRLAIGKNRAQRVRQDKREAKLKNAQEMFQMVIDNIPQSIFWKDHESRFLGCNQNFASDAGRSSPQELIGKTDYDMPWTKEESEFYVSIDRRVMNSDKAELRLVEHQLRPDGKQVWLEVNKVPLHDPKGKVIGILGTFEDITEQKTAEELEKARDAALQASTLKSNFMANMSHEIRTPLTLMLGPLYHILSGNKGALPAEMKEDLARIRRNGIRLLSLVNDILDFSKIESGNMAAEWQTVNVAEMVTEITEDIKPAASAKGIVLNLVTDFHPRLMPLDRRMFEKIIVNLLGNALKFTPRGGKVDVTLKSVDGRLELHVVDDGLGIPKDRFEFLFQRFFQVDGSTTRKFEGTGIGLALVKELTLLMGGSVKVDSETGKGAHFQIEIPIRTDLQLPSQAPEEAHQASERLSQKYAQSQYVEAAVASKRPVPSNRSRVLVVEDNADLRHYISDLLSESFELDVASDGNEALEKIKNNPPTVILSDVMMPGMDGYELVSRVKKDPTAKHIPFILLTAKAGSGEVVTGLNSGADDYLTKPFSPEELVARVRAANRLFLTHRELEGAAAHRSALIVRTSKASLATGVLHNVGNILNSVIVSVSMLQNRAKKIGADRVSKAARMLIESGGDILSRPVSSDGKSEQLPEYLMALGKSLEEDQSYVGSELNSLARDVEHIRTVITMQQENSKAYGLVENQHVTDIFEDALKLNISSFNRHGVEIETKVEALPKMLLDRHKILLILVNLLTNAGHAVRDSGRTDKRISVSAGRSQGGESLVIQVKDNGVGISPENFPKIFTHGFTTKKEGHGFGLHSCQLMAKEMDGTLTYQSEGEGKGAVFTLEVPIRKNVVGQVA